MIDSYYQELSMLKPSPDRSPSEVVQIQLEALQNNDLSLDNQGIRICFEFASPGNQESTGPLKRFIDMIKNPLYQPMIGFERAELSEAVIEANTAQQAVRLVGGKAHHAVYIFVLSRQQDEPYR